MSALDARPQPISDYDAAISRVQALQAADTDAVNPLCRTQLFTHGHATARAVVFLHGFTNCPQQFVRLAQQTHARGSNVLVPRLPHHGLRDRHSDAIGALNSAELVRCTDALIDLAHGLGAQVSVVGMSLGGTLALWAAQQRADLDRVVVIAPLLVPRNVPAWLLALLVPLVSRLPNWFVWWDPRQKEKLRGPQHAYPRFPTRGLAATLQIAGDVERRALRNNLPPRARDIRVIINANDPALNNAPTQAIVQRWRAHGREVSLYEFDASLGLIHDIVDEQQVEQRVDLVYPILEKFINE